MTRTTILGYILFFFFSFVIVFPQKALAHILRTDGSIGAVLHINPDDDPIAGQESLIIVELKDKTNKFTQANCSCQLKIIEGDRVVHQLPLFLQPTSDNSAQHPFTFPQKDVYQIQLTGTPTTPNAFQPFTLTYNIRVERESQNTSSQNSNFISTHVGHLIAGIGVLLFVIGGFFYQKLQKNKV